MNGKERWLLVAAVVAALVVGAAVASASRDRLIGPVPPVGNERATDFAAEDPEGPGRGESLPPESARAEGRDELEEAERRNEAIQLDALYAAALEGRGPERPTDFALDVAIEGLSPSRLDSMLLLWTDERYDDGLGYEFMSFGDQKGYIKISWQYLSENSDPQEVLVSEHGRIEYVGDLDAVTDVRDLPGANSRTVRVYDGEKTLKVSAVNIEGIDIAEVKEIALALFGHLPSR